MPFYVLCSFHFNPHSTFTSHGSYTFPVSFSEIYEEEEEELPQNPIAAAEAMKDALASGGVDKVADMGKESAKKLGGMVTKGFGGLAGKALGGFF